MNLKRFTIISSIIIALIVVATIVLGCVKVDNPLALPNADVIVVYSEGSSVEYTKEGTPAKYNRLAKEVKNITKLTILECMVNDYDLKRVPSQALDGKYDSFSKSTATSENYCVELVYEKKQSLLVSYEGDTKVVEFYALLFIVEESGNGQEIALHFSTTEGIDSYKSYTKSPITIEGKTDKLLVYINSSEVTGK